MPKFKSHIVNLPLKDEQGKTIRGQGNLGTTAWEPLNDAAKTMAIVDKAVEHGKYKRATPNEKEEIKAKLKNQEEEYAKRVQQF